MQYIIYWILFASILNYTDLASARIWKPPKPPKPSKPPKLPSPPKFATTKPPVVIYIPVPKHHTTEPPHRIIVTRPRHPEVPIEFNNTPSEYTANETSNIKLECVVTGKPKPEVLWYKNGRHVTNGNGFSYDGDSLVISNISYHNAGKYICRAKQTLVNAMREKTVNLQVFHKPYFSEARKTLIKIKNQTSSIKCEADADPPARYTWLRNNSVVVTASGSLAINLTNGTIELPLLNNTEYDSLVCQANNSYGSHSKIFNITAMQVPPAPSMKLLKISKNEIKWEITSNRNDFATGVNIEYRKKSDNKWNVKHLPKPHSSVHEYTLSKLNENTEYLIRARSVNPAGISEFSKELKVKTSLANQLTASIGVLFAIILILYNFNV